MWGVAEYWCWVEGDDGGLMPFNGPLERDQSGGAITICGKFCVLLSCFLSSPKV